MYFFRIANGNIIAVYFIAITIYDSVRMYLTFA